MIRPSHDGLGAVIRIGDKDIGEIYYHLYQGRDIIRPREIRVADNNVEIQFQNSKIFDSISEKDGLVKVERKWTIGQKGKWRLSFSYKPFNRSLDQWTIPSVMYHENRHGSGKFPKGGLEVGWSFREDRMPIPACSVLFNMNEFQAVFTSPAKDDSEIASVKSYLHNDEPAFDIRIPFVEEPRTYTEKGIMLGGLTGRTGRFFQLKSSDLPYEYQRTFYISAAESMDHPTSIYEILFRRANEEFGAKEPAHPITDWKKYFLLKLKHLMFLLVYENEIGVCGFKMGKGNGLFQGYYEYIMGSFLGKNLEAATVLCRMADELNDENLIETADRIGGFFLKGARPGGVHYDMYDLKKKRWGSYCGPVDDERLRNGVNARSNGEVMLHYLKLFHLLKDRGLDRPEFLGAAAETARFYLTNQLEDGAYGRWRQIDGTPINSMGSNGAYIVVFLTAYDAYKGGDKKIQASLKRAAEYYSRQMDELLFYADTLDADCVDKEAGIAYLRAFLDLYEHFRKPEYLICAQRAAAFVLGWTWTYNTAWPKGTAAHKAGLKTRGLTAVSVAHHHLDFYGFHCGYDFLRLWRASGDDFYKKCGMMMINACTQLTAVPENMLGRSKEFTGWQPEQIDQTNWDYKHRFLGTKGRFHSCIAWPVVLALGSLLDIREEFSELVNFYLNPGDHLNDAF